MHPRLRTLLIALGAAIFGVVAAVNLASEGYVLSVLLLIAVLWIIAEWLKGPLPESWVLGIVLIGYLVGNRGFAQFSLASRLPLLPAEAALLVCVPAMLVRAGFRQTVFLRRNLLDYAILLWMTVATIRLPMDWHDYGAMAVRDYAMVYYATFFFAGQSLGQHLRSSALLRRALTVAFLLLPPVAVAFLAARDFFFEYLSVRGVPLVFHKSDLIATYLAAGFFWFWWRRCVDDRRIWLIPATVSWLLIAVMASPRAAMVATLGVTVFWLLARHWRILAFQIAVGFTALTLTVAVVSFSNANIKKTPLYSAYEHAISIVDFQGKGTYINRASGDPGDNNRFRLVWWRAVYEETLDINPAFGLGFGADLSTRFLADYDWLMVEDFSARSPHSMLMTMFGRLGIIGLGLWLLIAAGMARISIAVFRERKLAAMGWWSVAWALWFSACFGVVLEGPMGAVPFWVALGLAAAASRSEEVASDDQPDAAGLPERPPADQVAAAS